MNDIRPEAHLSVLEFARTCGLTENRVRVLLGKNELSSIKVGLRRYLPESEVVRRFAEDLVRPAISSRRLEWLRANAASVGAELSPDADLIRGAELYLSAANGEPSSTPESAPVAKPEPEFDPWAAPRPKVEQRELELVGD